MNCLPQQGARNSHDKQSPQLNVITSMRTLKHINWKVHSKKEGVNTSTHNPLARQHTSDHYWQPPSVFFVPQGPSSTVAKSQTEQQKELLTIRGDQQHSAGLYPSHVGVHTAISPKRIFKQDSIRLWTIGNIYSTKLNGERVEVL